MFVVLQWYYDERNGKSIIPELSAVIGPFPDQETINRWMNGSEKWSGWGRYEYEIKELQEP